MQENYEKHAREWRRAIGRSLLGGFCITGITPIAELVEESVSRTPPHLEPIVPNLGNRLKIKRFACVWSHVRISVWYVLTIGSGLALMNRVNCSQSRDFR